MMQQMIRNLGRMGVLAFISMLTISIMSHAGRSEPVGDSSIALKSPPFVGVAYAEGTAVDNFADEEAGIAAYFDAGMAINLNDVDQLFRTIEEQTSSYILGSLALTDYTEDHDPHVYISTDGWVMAYYRDNEPTGKIFDWRHYDGGSNLPTKLELGLDIVAAEIGAVAIPSYYHFNYPNATDLMLIADMNMSDNIRDPFEVTMPANFTYYERSWSLAKTPTRSSYDAHYYLNDTEIAVTTLSGWEYLEGSLSAGQLPADALHTIETSINQWNSDDAAFGGLTLVYRVP